MLIRRATAMLALSIAALGLAGGVSQAEAVTCKPITGCNCGTEDTPVCPFTVPTGVGAMATPEAQMSSSATPTSP